MYQWSRSNYCAWPFDQPRIDDGADHEDGTDGADNADDDAQKNPNPNRATLPYQE